MLLLTRPPSTRVQGRAAKLPAHPARHCNVPAPVSPSRTSWLACRPLVSLMRHLTTRSWNLVSAPGCAC